MKDQERINVLVEVLSQLLATLGIAFDRLDLKIDELLEELEPAAYPEKDYCLTQKGNKMTSGAPRFFELDERRIVNANYVAAIRHARPTPKEIAEGGSEQKVYTVVVILTDGTQLLIDGLTEEESLSRMKQIAEQVEDALAQ